MTRVGERASQAFQGGFHAFPGGSQVFRSGSQVFRGGSRGFRVGAGVATFRELISGGFAGLLIFGVTSGCGDQSPQHATVTGSVTAEGRPVTGAVITFEPVGDTSGPKASAAVIGGQYEVAADGRLEGGEYRIRISMMPDEFVSKLHEKQPDAFPPRGSVVDPTFDSSSDLRRELHIDRPNGLDFEIEFRRGSPRG